MLTSICATIGALCLIWAVWIVIEAIVRNLSK